MIHIVCSDLKSFDLTTNMLLHAAWANQPEQPYTAPADAVCRQEFVLKPTGPR